MLRLILPLRESSLPLELGVECCGRQTLANTARDLRHAIREAEDSFLPMTKSAIVHRNCENHRVTLTKLAAPCSKNLR